jgi:hypothetical protein
MTFAYLALALGLGAPADLTVSAAAPQKPSTWFGSVQIGAGGQGADSVALIRPRLGTEGDAYRVVLAAPLFVRLRDRPHVDGGELLLDWHDPAVYAGLIEAVDYRSPTGTISAHVGELVQESLGHAVLVDKLTAQHDPLRHRTGARVDLRLPRVRASALIDSFIRPHVVAGSATLAPLAFAGLDDGERLVVTAEAAADLRAPGFDGNSPLAAFDLDLAFHVWRSSTLAVQLFVAGAALTHPAYGAHLGAQLEWRGRGDDSFAFRLETVASGDGYTAGYFDELYSVERHALPARGWMPKAARRPAGAVGVRGALDASFGPARFGFAATLADPRRPGAISVYLRIARPSWAVAAALSQREVSDGVDLVAIGPATSASADVAVDLLGGVFGFSQVRHSFRRPEFGELEPVFDWIVGLGYAAQAGQTQGS